MKKLLKEKILIFALARTGSTSLLNLLDIHESISGISEPFNHKNKENLKRYALDGFDPTRIKSVTNMHEELTKILKNYNCVKHVWHPSGFPFNDLYPDHGKDKYVSLNEHLLASFDKIIFLNRRNILKRIISGLISEQAGTWFGDVDSERKKIEEFDFNPISEDDVDWHIKFEQSFITRMRNGMRKMGLQHYEIWYEDIFGDNISLDDKIQKFYDIVKFLNLPVNFDNGNMEKVRELLGEKMKLNTNETYMRVPNIREIEAKFGSDENGWLMK